MVKYNVHSEVRMNDEQVYSHSKDFATYSEALCYFDEQAKTPGVFSVYIQEIRILNKV